MVRRECEVMSLNGWLDGVHLLTASVLSDEVSRMIFHLDGWRFFRHRRDPLYFYFLANVVFKYFITLDFIKYSPSSSSGELSRLGGFVLFNLVSQRLCSWLLVWGSHQSRIAWEQLSSEGPLCWRCRIRMLNFLVSEELKNRSLSRYSSWHRE